MAENTKIQWCDHTLNWWLGCQKVSPGCDNCYAEEWARRYEKPVFGPGADRQRTADSTWASAEKYQRLAKKTGRPQVIFTNSLADFWDNAVPPEWREDAMVRMEAARDCIWLVLTKRPQNILRLWPRPMPMNIWLGFSPVNQHTFDRDMPAFIEAGRKTQRPLFLSCEPLLGPMDISSCLGIRGLPRLPGRQVDWVIGGGESGPGARDSAPDWYRQLLRQCDEAVVPYFMKQMSRGRPIPPDLMVREYPDAFGKESS